MKINYYIGKNGQKTEDKGLEMIKQIKETCSTVPLVNYWINKPEEKLTALLNKVGIYNQNEVEFRYEFPVSSTSGKGKSSMTDLMIIGEKFNIAIESKYTEPKYPYIAKWLTKGNKENRKLVLDSWVNMIHGQFKTIEVDDDIIYQILHRTASAMSKDFSSKEKHIVLFQLFHQKDKIEKKVNETVIELSKMAKFTANVKDLEYLLHAVEYDDKIFGSEKYFKITSEKIEHC